MTATLAEQIDRTEVVELTQDLVQIPSQYIEETLAQHDELAEFLANHMEEIGLDTEVLEEVDGYPVVIGTTPGPEDGPTIGVVGHYSTVAIGDENDWEYDPLGGKVDNGRMYGRGTADQKGGIAAVLTACKTLLESDIEREGRLRIILVPGEGCTKMALKPVGEKHPDAVVCDAYLDSDGGPNRVSLVHSGYVWVELETTGTPVHSGALTEDGSVPINPVETLIDVLTELKDGDWMDGEPHSMIGPEYGRYSEDPIVDVNVFNAGAKVNQIPPAARAQIDIRPVPSQTVDGILEILEATLKDLESEVHGLDISYRVLNESKNNREVSEDHWIIENILETCRVLEEPEPELVGSSGGGRPTLSQFGPVMHFGAGGGENAHAPDENIPIDTLERGARMHAVLYEKLFSSSRN